MTDWRRPLRRLIAPLRERFAPRQDSQVGSPPAHHDPAEWWRLLPFTTHRIVLADGVATAPSGVDALVDVRTEVVVEACGGSLEGRTVVDLGCLEGGFTLAFAQHGATHSLGVEAREISVRRCELARSLLGISNAEFVCADIKDELVRHAPFDVVFAAGILYHVADPVSLLKTMRASCRDVAVIDTHIAHPEHSSHHCSQVITRELCGRPYRGRIFPEYPPSTTEHDKATMLWAAWSDTDAFWPLEADLVAMIRDAGFTSVEKVDVVGQGRNSRWAVDTTNRVLYVARVGPSQAIRP